MNASQKSRSRPWIWIALFCLTVAVLGFLVGTERVSTIGSIILVLLVLFPVFMACVGGYCGKWSLALGLMPAIGVGLMAGPLRVDLSDGCGTDEAMLISALGFLALLLLVLDLSRFVAKVRQDRFVPPGHCRECGRDLGFRVNRPCPACGEAVLCLNCGYNLTGNVSGLCPECETAAPRGRAKGE